MASIDKVKQLRQETGVSIIECKKALEDSKGDIEKAKDFLRKKGKDFASKKSGREVKSGIIASYIHPNKKVGVMVDIRCESDFVAKSDNFQALAHEICLQIAAMNPLFVSQNDIPKKVLKKEKEIYEEQLKGSGKPKEIWSNIVKGKLDKYQKEKSLISQTWIKDDKKTVKNLLEDYIVKLGENIIINRFVRYEL